MPASYRYHSILALAEIYSSGYDFHMSTSAAQESAFYKEVLENNTVFTIRDKDGYPAPYSNPNEERAMPFWSLQSRAEKIIASVPAYTDFEPVEISLQEFKEKWLPGLEKDQLLVGINWSGDTAHGYDETPEEVLKYLQ